MMAEFRVPAPGSAECLSALLNTRSLGCSHFPKHRVDPVQSQHWYPSRLGFFQVTSPETGISFLDTGKLCKQCLDLAVPDGFVYWSMFLTLKANSISPSLDAPTTRWLDTTPSSGEYPLLFPAGTEKFAQAQPQSGNIAPHLMIPPKAISIPQVAGAKEAWHWMQEQRKPFYIDQLHLARGWTPLAEKMAVGDSMIAEKIGKAFVPTFQKAEPTVQESFPLTAAVKAASPEIKTSKINTAIIDKNELEQEPSKASISAEKTAKKTSSVMKIRKRVSMDKSTKDQVNDTTKPQKPSPSSSRSLTVTAPTIALGMKIETQSAVKVESSPPTTTARSIYTKNWCRHDPIPFDKPITTLTLADYERQAGSIDHKTVSGSRLPLERLLEQNATLLNDGSVFSGPTSPRGSSRLVSLLGPTGQGERPVAVADSKFMDSITQKTSIKSSSPAKRENANTTSKDPSDPKISEVKSSGDKPSAKKFFEHKNIENMFTKETSLEAMDMLVKGKSIKDRLAKERSVKTRSVKERFVSDKFMKGNHVEGKRSRKEGSTNHESNRHAHGKEKKVKGKPSKEKGSAKDESDKHKPGKESNFNINLSLSMPSSKDKSDKSESEKSTSAVGSLSSSPKSSITSSPTWSHQSSEYEVSLQSGEERGATDIEEGSGSEDQGHSHRGGDTSEEHTSGDEGDVLDTQDVEVGRSGDDEHHSLDSEHQESDVSVGQPSDEEEHVMGTDHESEIGSEGDKPSEGEGSVTNTDDNSEMGGDDDQTSDEDEQEESGNDEQQSSDESQKSSDEDQPSEEDGRERSTDDEQESSNENQSSNEEDDTPSNEEDDNQSTCEDDSPSGDSDQQEASDGDGASQGESDSN